MSAGASKSGMTSLFHRRFWPDDVDATVAYVSPIMFSMEDERFLPWLAATGTPEGKKEIHAFQRRLLEHEDELLPSFRDWFARRGLALSVPAGPTFEDAVDSYEWNFWQRHVFDYADIPGPDAPYDAWIEHLATTVRLFYSSDSWRDYFKAYVYQVHTQLGGPAVDKSHLTDLMRHQPLDPWTAYDFPRDLALAWDGGAAMRDVLRWIQTEGERIVLVYGGMDPWTGGAIDVAADSRVVKVVEPYGDHQVRILSLDQPNQVLTVLGGWLGVKITAPAARGITVPPFRADPALRVGPPEGALVSF